MEIWERQFLMLENLFQSFGWTTFILPESISKNPLSQLKISWGEKEKQTSERLATYTWYY